ncbi:cell cycle checkpoint control protein RAD9A isoform X2 [Astyanax mexicanus]|uniref:Cell cycle checkpoint control protein RAD9A n=1 Tax=Astyanax mexicanus TaxID=7994 RepID=A0A8B9KC48_ASTMX|nr:cell cycle checkpoint control protein RAD9A isoform X2 [Astyanax mexicanus]
MRCTIAGNGVKVFGRAVHALSRIGEDIWLDPLQKGLAVRSVNSAQSAYACFLFSPLFFQHYTANLDQGRESKGVKCKVSLKSVLPIFRSVATLERSVCKCEISINVSDSRVKFQFNCRHGITKTHNLGYQECEALQAVFPTHLCPNILKAQPKLLSDIVMHFPTSQEEITLSVSPLRFKLKSYYEEENDLIKSMNTEMSLHPDEFDYFQVGVDSDVTFCLKELRGLLSFAEAHGLPVSIHFGASGKPVSFSVEGMVLEAVVVLATLASPDSENPSQESIPQEAPAPRNRSEVCPGNISIADISMDEGPLEAEAAGVAPKLPAFPTEEQVASSQGSPVFIPDLHMRNLLQLHGDEVGLSRPSLCDVIFESESLTSPATPATFKFRSLVFGAVSSDQVNVSALELPSLVCASDTEDDTGEDSGMVEE